MTGARVVLRVVASVLLLGAWGGSASAAEVGYGWHEGALLDEPLVLPQDREEIVVCQWAAGGATACGAARTEAPFVAVGDRVLVVADEPRRMRAPAVYRVGGEGLAFSVDRLSSEGEIGFLVEEPGLRLRAVAAHDLGSLALVETAAGETVVQGAAVPEGAVWIVVEEGRPGASALVRWEDPLWYARAPTFGHVAAVAVLGLLVVLYHGRSPRRFG